MDERGSLSERYEEQEAAARGMREEAAVERVAEHYAEERSAGVGWAALLSGLCLIGANVAFRVGRVTAVSPYTVSLELADKIYSYRRMTLAVSGGLVVCGVVLGVVTWVIGIRALHRIGLGHSKAYMSTLSIMLSTPLILLVTLPMLGVQRRALQRDICEANLRLLGLAFADYRESGNGAYPPAERWADALGGAEALPEGAFRCPGGRGGRCHYAVNPHGLAGFRPEKKVLKEADEGGGPLRGVVVLFETRGGWNQAGGAELLSFENHWGKGAHVMFADGRVEFVGPEEAGELDWGAGGAELIIDN